MAGDSVEKLEDVIIRSAEQVAGQMRAAKEAISTVIFGQEKVVENTLVTILSGGHALLIGVPGLAKTKLVETLGTTLGLDAKRIQFTPDLMPSDILGAEVLDESVAGKRSFRFIAGPVFAQLLMADEINRASPRTQSALLQAMQEQHITVAGARHDLPKPFHVLATQNPLEQEGTYPLPEAQLDRFLMEIDVDYPDRDAIPVPLFYKGADGRYVGVNRAYEHAFGVTRESLVGKTVMDLEFLPHASRVLFERDNALVLAGGPSVHREVDLPY
eukprot:gene1172-1580_t